MLRKRGFLRRQHATTLANEMAAVRCWLEGLIRMSSLLRVEPPKLCGVKQRRMPVRWGRGRGRRRWLHGAFAGHISRDLCARTARLVLQCPAQRSTVVGSCREPKRPRVLHLSLCRNAHCSSLACMGQVDTQAYPDTTSCRFSLLIQALPAIQSPIHASCSAAGLAEA